MTSQQGSSEPASEIEHSRHVALLAAWLAIWPQNCMGGCREKHIDISADKETVIFNLVFYSIELTPPDNLTRA